MKNKILVFGTVVTIIFSGAGCSKVVAVSSEPQFNIVDSYGNYSIIKSAYGYGVVDINGTVHLEAIYDGIMLTNYGNLFVVQNAEKFAVMTTGGIIVADFRDEPFCEEEIHQLATNNGLEQQIIGATIKLIRRKEWFIKSFLILILSKLCD